MKRLKYTLISEWAMIKSGLIACINYYTLCLEPTQFVSRIRIYNLKFEWSHNYQMQISKNSNKSEQIYPSARTNDTNVFGVIVHVFACRNQIYRINRKRAISLSLFLLLSVWVCLYPSAKTCMFWYYSSVKRYETETRMLLPFSMVKISYDVVVKNWKRGSWPWPYKDTRIRTHSQKLWCCSRCTHTSKSDEKIVFTIALCFWFFLFLFCSQLIFYFFSFVFILPLHHFIWNTLTYYLYSTRVNDLTQTQERKKHHERISRKGNKQASEQTKKSTEKNK